MYNSFYGGKQGHSYNIVAHYDSVKDMVTAFNNGGNYTDVAFDEYVIIDTIVNLNQKNNPENGLIYRRGYNFSEGFTLLGQVNNNTGEQLTSINPDELTTVTLYANVLDQEINSTDMPTSGTYSVTNVVVPRFYNYSYKIIDITPESEEEPVIDEEEIEEENEHIYQAILINNHISFNNIAWTKAWKQFVTHPGGGAIYIGQIVGPTGGAAAIQMITWEEFLENADGNWQFAPYIGTDDIIPVPGYDPNKSAEDGYDTNGFFDKIQFGYCTLKDSNDNVTDAYIAFNMPYTIFNFEAHGISAYPPANADEITNGYIDSETGITYKFNNTTHLWEYDNLISENEDSIDHKFYKHYDIKIPKGVHGQDIKELKIINNENEYLDPTSELDVINTANKRTYQMGYRLTNYDYQENGEVTEDLIKIGAYNVLTQLTTNTLTASQDDPRYQHEHYADFTFNYTAHDPDTIIHQVIERIWVQDQDDSTLYAYPYVAGSANNKTLLHNHMYVLYSNYQYPVDLGVVNEIISVWNESVGSLRPIGYSITENDNNGRPLAADYNYFITTGNRDSNGNYIPICLGLTKKILAVDRLENIPSSNVFEFTNTSALCLDCSNLDPSQRRTRCYKYNNAYYFYNPADDDEDNLITFGDFKQANLGQFYTYFNDGSTTLLPIAEIEQIALEGDLLLIRFRNLDYSTMVHFPSSMIRMYNGQEFINLGSVVRGNHIYTNYETLDALKFEHPNGLDDNGSEAYINRAGWLVSVGHDNDIVVEDKFDENENFLGVFPVNPVDAIVVEENGVKIISYPEGSIYDASNPPSNLEIEEAVGYKFYAYDYRAAKWYAVQDLSSNAVRAEYSIIIAKEDSQAVNEPDDENKNFLNDGGAWFVISE